KPDAPGWMQRRGLTWVFRILSEPRRLLWRYLRYNTLFLFYLGQDTMKKRSQ
ncbi:MAG: WecB/TagA/CpsF family glycosyltransferase, partial [Chthoniobacterales bacterium]